MMEWQRYFEHCSLQQVKEKVYWIFQFRRYPPCCLVAWHFACCLTIFYTPRPQWYLPSWLIVQTTGPGSAGLERSCAARHTHKTAALKLVPSVDMLRHLVGSRVTNRPVKGSIRPEDDALRRIANGEPIDSLLLNFSWTSHTCSKLILSRQTFSATWGRYLAYFGFMNFMDQFKNSICIHPISLINYDKLN